MSHTEQQKLTSDVVQFHSRAQIELAEMCIACGCPDGLDMNMARTINNLSWSDGDERAAVFMTKDQAIAFVDSLEVTFWTDFLPQPHQF